MNDPIAHNAYVNEVFEYAKEYTLANPKLSQAEKVRIVRELEESRDRGLVHLP